MPLLVDAMLGNKESGARSWCSRKSERELSTLQHLASDVDGSSVKKRFEVPAVFREHVVHACRIMCELFWFSVLTIRLSELRTAEELVVDITHHRRPRQTDIDAFSDCNKCKNETALISVAI
jgi:hypothetical protein